MMIKPILRSEATLKNLNVAEVDKMYNAKLRMIYCRQVITTFTAVKVEFFTHPVF